MTREAHPRPPSTFEDFRRLATDDRLSPYEKIGFPDAYRAGHEEAIVADIVRKLPRLQGAGGRVMDIGPGCSDVPHLLIELCGTRGHQLTLVDSAEMLARLPDAPHITKIAGMYPAISPELEALRGQIDVLLCYSVLHYIMVDTNLFDFLDVSLELLRQGGMFLIGDIPNVTKRKRFFASDTGKAFHRAFTGEMHDPVVTFNTVERSKIDDAVILALLLRARSAGFDAYVVPQAPDLPMANRREDVLIVRP
jgi:hypothetical protein